jgi:hypothetical protein
MFIKSARACETDPVTALDRLARLRVGGSFPAKGSGQRRGRVRQLGRTSPFHTGEWPAVFATGRCKEALRIGLVLGTFRHALAGRAHCYEANYRGARSTSHTRCSWCPMRLCARGRGRRDRLRTRRAAGSSAPAAIARPYLAQQNARRCGVVKARFGESASQRQNADCAQVND